MIMLSKRQRSQARLQLDALVKLYGSAAALARVLGLEATTVRQWVTRHLVSKKGAHTIYKKLGRTQAEALRPDIDFETRDED